MLRAAATTVLLCCALYGAAAVTYGQPGVGSQYQLFGGPITDTTAHRVSPIRSGVNTAFALAVEGDAQQKPAAATAEAIKPAQACDSGFVFSDVFGKCLPAPGKDGYIGKAPYDERVKGKGATESSAFAPITAPTFAPVMPLRTAPLTGATEERPQPQPQPQPRDGAQMSPRGRAIATPARQLRLACPPGFGFEPAMGACIAPAAALQHQAMRMRMNRPRGAEDDDDDDDSDEELRHSRQRMIGHRFRRHMFGHRYGFGGPRILAPVFVFVLPPLDRNATSRFGMGFGGRQQRIHEIHPSMVGPIGGATSTTATPATSAPATPGQPVGPEKPKAAEGETKPGPKGTGAGSDTSALRGAFVNPIIGSGKSLPLKSHSAIGTEGERIRGDDDGSAIRGSMRSEADPRVRMLKRHAFVSPLIESHAHTGTGSGADSEAA